MKKIVKKHPLAIRWFHWINFPVLGIMIWSGLLIYWANDVYKVGFGDKTLIKFFPQSFYQTLDLKKHLAEGMAYHFFFMWLFFLNGIAYILYTIFSGEWRYLVPNRYSFKEAWKVLLHDLHIRKAKPPQGKYNAAQRIAYSAIIIMGIGSVLTGLAIYKPVQLGWLTAMFGGYKMSRIIHFALTIGYVLFFLIHIIQVIIAGWNNFQAMVTGFEVARIKEEPVVEPTVMQELPIKEPVTEPIVVGEELPTEKPSGEPVIEEPLK
jgi:thiosulfate reductase cytochrome b subunit